MAVSTPPGRGGIGVVRVSGGFALEYVCKLIADTAFKPIPNRAYYKVLRDPLDADLLDEGVLTYFASPRSFTGEDVIELSCHGSPVVLTRIVGVLTRLGCRPAVAGEFTLRALTNKKLDVSQAEAIRDLIDAQSYAAASQAMRQMSGELSAQVRPFSRALLDIIVPLESSLEFVEDDLPAVYVEQIKDQLRSLINKLQTLAATYSTGRLIRDGAKAVLLGRPNVGKSSIFNALLAYERSIVTNVPGTTRDSLSELVTIAGIPVLLIDTAGVRDSVDPVEQIGVERSKLAAVDADVLLLIFDATSEFTEEDQTILNYARQRRHLIVINKCDDFERSYDNSVQKAVGSNFLKISAITGFGLDQLRSAIAEVVTDGRYAHSDSNCVVTSARHHDLLALAAESLHMSIDLLEQDASEEIILVGLYNALRSIGDITGETTSDDVLGRIFSTFCIGK